MRNLVDGINIHKDLLIKARYKDCIYGKHIIYLFNETGAKEQETLERVYIDIQRLAQIQSTERTMYFILLIDGSYLVKVEQQTRKRLRRVHMDMRREWINSTWEEYQKL